MAMFGRIGSTFRGSLRTRMLVDDGSLLPAANLLSRSMSSSKLFIGGLAWGVDEQSLRTAFETYGNINEVKVIIDRETGRSRGFGFVCYDSPDEAKAAREAMDGKDVGGRNIRVDFATDRPMSTPRRDFDTFDDLK